MFRETFHQSLRRILPVCTPAKDKSCFVKSGKSMSMGSTFGAPCLCHKDCLFHCHHYECRMMQDTTHQKFTTSTYIFTRFHSMTLVFHMGLRRTICNRLRKIYNCGLDDAFYMDLKRIICNRWRKIYN